MYALDESIPIDQFPRFFEDARMNFAENMLCGKDDDLAIISVGEDNLWSPHKYTWKELRKMVAKYADALSGSGLRKGEVVAGMLFLAASDAIFYETFIHALTAKQ